MRHLVLSFAGRKHRIVRWNGDYDSDFIRPSTLPVLFFLLFLPQSWKLEMGSSRLVSSTIGSRATSMITKGKVLGKIGSWEDLFLCFAPNSLFCAKLGSWGRCYRRNSTRQRLFCVEKNRCFPKRVFFRKLLFRKLLLEKRVWEWESQTVSQVGEISPWKKALSRLGSQVIQRRFGEIWGGRSKSMLEFQI